MNFIKKSRIAVGYTQKVLAEKTGLSLRTIQRLENQNTAPKGHTLTTLANTFNISPSALRAKFHQADISNEQSDKASIKLINLSALTLFLFPLGNIIMPFWIWRKKRTSKLVEKVGRKIINIQILWTISLYFSLCVAPFIAHQSLLILWVLFIGLAVNVMLIIATAYFTQKGNYAFFNLPFSLL